MSEDLLTPVSFPTFINRKIYALKSDWKPAEADLNVIRELLDVVQEERLVSDEEVREWKRAEKKVLEKQSKYKKITESMEKGPDYFIPLTLLYTLLIKFGFKILQFVTQVECRNPSFTLWCPIDFIVVAVYIFHFHGSDLRLKFLTAQPVQPEVLENEDDGEEVNDSHDSMTSTELQSKQKDLLNRWKQLEEERQEARRWNFSFSLVRFVIMIYFFVRCLPLYYLMTANSFSFFLSSTRPEKLFFLVEFISTDLILTVFITVFIVGKKKPLEDQMIIKK